MPRLRTGSMAAGFAMAGLLMMTAASASGAPKTAWTVQTTPRVAGFVLQATSCASAKQCVAVGSSATFSSAALLAESWQGRTWTRTKMASPAGQGQTATIDGLSCPSSSTCIAVGYYSVGSTVQTSHSESFAEVERNGAWTLQKIGPPAGAVGTSLQAVSCWSASGCVAVGTLEDKSASSALSEAWNGSAWKDIKTAAVSGHGTFVGVSCPSSGHCTAVGNVENKQFHQFVLVERLTASSWRVVSTPKVAGQNASLESVSCPTSTQCFAVGGYTPKATGRPLAESGNGSSWKLVKTAKLTIKTNSFLDGISCTGVRSCRAVGALDDQGSTSVALAEAWNGTKWVRQSVEAPSPAAGFAAVSCSAASACTAVGDYFPTLTASTPLVERS
jgi:hypothetical protein